jgi:hypothetical protein
VLRVKIHGIEQVECKDREQAWGRYALPSNILLSTMKTNPYFLNTDARS